MKNIYIYLIILTLCISTGLGGCAWMGRTAGKAQAKIERHAGETEDGYHQGYEAEKGKSKPAPAPKPQQNEQPNAPQTPQT